LRGIALINAPNSKYARLIRQALMENKTIGKVLGCGGNVTTLNMYAKALKDGYQITDELRSEMLETAVLMMRSVNERTRIAALKVLANLDALNVRRERNEITETAQDRQEQTARMRAALATPEGRAAMAAATVAMMGEKAQVVAAEGAKTESPAPETGQDRE
jgi:hypothetical protein